MKINQRYIIVLFIVMVATIAISIFNTYNVFKLEKAFTQIADINYVDFKARIIQEQVSDLGVRVNNLEYPATKTQDETMTSTTAKNVFQRAGIHVGDKIAGMTITSSTDRFVYFSGQVTLRGDVVVNNDPTQDSIQGNLYFNVAKVDWGKLPRILGDDRTAWFVFSNALAERVFKQSGPATITIDHYVIDSTESEVANTAELIRANR